MTTRDVPPKLLVWTGIPTHHQSGFFEALRAHDGDLRVHYYSRVSEDRLRLGWGNPDSLPPGEHYVSASLDSLHACEDWRERVHIIPGCSALFLIRLAAALSQARVPWLHWSEPSRTVPWSFLTLPVKRFYATLINTRGLGALAIGDCARRDFMRWGVREELIRFLPYAVPTPPQSAISPDVAIPGKLRFVFVGALCQRKGIDILLHAFRQVHSAFPDTVLELVGSDESNGRYTQLATRLNLNNAVRFTGSVPAGQIANVFHRCDVFVLPSRFDGWGVVINEAAALGKAIISTEPTGAAHHLVSPGKNGHRVPAQDVNALAAAMRAYCFDRSLAAKHGEQSRAIFREFTPERNAQRLREAISSLQ